MLNRRALFGLAMASGAAMAAPMLLRVPGSPFPETERHPYPAALLELALQRAGLPFRLQMQGSQTFARQIRELALSHVDLAPLPAVDGPYDGAALRRVDFPLRPGLLGLRLLVVRRERVAELARVQSLADWKRLRLGYGSDWADRPVFESQGFQLVTARSTEQLYRRLAAGECDVLSRGLNEVEFELQALGPLADELSILPGQAWHYPLDDCFFLAPGHAALQRTLLEGLQALRREGGWLRLLRQHYGPLLRRHQLLQRSLHEVPGYPVASGVPPELLDLKRWLPQLADGKG